MKTNKKKLFLLPALVLSIASCSTDIARYPKDYKETLYSELQKFSDDNDLSLVLNSKEQFYNEISSASQVYSRTVNLILNKIAEVAGNTDVKKANSRDKSKIAGDKVYELAGDFNFDNSVATGSIPTDKKSNLITRAKDSSLNAAKTNERFIKDDLFYETRFVTSLKEDYLLPDDFNEESVRTTGVLVTPDMKFDDVFLGDYTKYLENEEYEDIVRNYLVSEYIYTRAY